MPTASAEQSGFSIEIAVRGKIKIPSPEPLLCPGPTADAQRTRAHSEHSAAFPRMLLQPHQLTS